MDAIEEEGQDYREELLSTLPKSISPPRLNSDFEGNGMISDNEQPKVVNGHGSDSSLQSELSKVTRTDNYEPAKSSHTELAHPTKEKHEPVSDADDGFEYSGPKNDDRSRPGMTSYVEDNGKQLTGKNDNTTSSFTQGAPHINVLPATPGTSLNNRASQSTDTAKASALERDTDSGKLTSRKHKSPTPDRPLTPNSVRSAGKDPKSKNFLKAFLHLVFVDWIGGLIMRICGGGRDTLLAMTALLFVTIAPALYFSTLTT